MQLVEAAPAGLPLQSLNVDNVEEIQIKSSGYAAEYGGATGGVVNVLTKSGTNTWHGDVRFYFTGDTLVAGPRHMLRRNPQVSTQAEYITYPEDPYHVFEPGFSVGGPIRTNRAWFYLAYQPLVQHTDRIVTFALDGSSGPFGQDVTRQLLTASQTLQLGSRVRTRAAFNFSPARTEGLLPAQAGTDSPVSDFGVTGAHADHVRGWNTATSVSWLNEQVSSSGGARPVGMAEAWQQRAHVSE